MKEMGHLRWTIDMVLVKAYYDVLIKSLPFSGLSSRKIDFKCHKVLLKRISFQNTRCGPKLFEEYDWPRFDGPKTEIYVEFYRFDNQIKNNF